MREEKDCPPADVIAAFAAGVLQADRASIVREHVSQCDLCLETVGHLAHSSSVSVSPPGEVAHPSLAQAGLAIGPYTLLRRVGEGGMGEVWEAQQAAPVRRIVALKLLKAGMDTRQVVTRFEAERQVLALMQHPGIAQVFDAGITDTGRPYFVMEFVDGVRITKYCDEAGLRVTERLALFQQVCEAVQHAHQKGVIHRDLKPSNVLVTRQAGKAQPKVIDFGLAKATRQEDGLTELTQLGMVLGTPAYASPEQMGVGAKDVDTRSDVYSLGALLYEILIGVIPFESDKRSPTALLELRQAMRDRDPTRPSARFSTLGERASAIAKARGTEPQILRKQLRGDLDWIVMKALEKDRERRYTSPNELSLDIERYLKHEPLVAGPPTTAYRLSKFVRRHRVGTAFASVLVVLVVAFGVVSAVQVQRIARERDRATAEAAKASSINTFLQETIASSDPWQTGSDISIRETLQRAVAKVNSSFKDQPLVAAAVRRTIGKSYVALGRLDEAESLYKAALETRMNQLGRMHPDTVEVLADLAWLENVRGNHEVAVKQQREVVALRRQVFGSEHTVVADSLIELSEHLEHTGEYEEATRVAEESLAIRERLLGKDNLDVANSLIQLGALADRRDGNYALAIDLTKRGLTIHRRLLGPDDLRTAAAAGDLGAKYYTFGNNEAAEPLYREAMDVFVRVVGKDQPETLVKMENLAGVLTAMKRYDEAIPLIEEVLAKRKAVLGPDNRLVARTMVNIAQLHASAGQPDRSHVAFAEAVPRFAKAYGEQHPDVATVMNMYGRMLVNAKKFSEAETVCGKGVAIAAAALPADHPGTARLRVCLAEALTAREQFTEAESLLLQARPHIEKAFGPTAAVTKRTDEALVRLYTAWRKPEKVVEIQARMASD